MSDNTAHYDALKDQSKQRKRNNLEYSTRKLKESGIEFESKNGGVHLIVSQGLTTIDYWPSTGKFIDRGGDKSGRGVNNLLLLLKRNAG